LARRVGIGARPLKAITALQSVIGASRGAETVSWPDVAPEINMRHSLSAA
jgi:hypothetical protein